MREIASLCRAETNLALAIEWLEAAAISVSTEEKLEVLLRPELTSARRLHDKLWEETGGAEPSEGFFISRVETDLGNVTSGRQLRERERGRSDLSSLQFSLLCRGETLPHTKTVSDHQQCSISTVEDAYFILGQCALCRPVLTLISIYVAPLHIEVLSEDPRIVMFHDFLTELEMNTLKQMTLAEIEVK